MIASIPFEVSVILGFFYAYGLFAIITGKIWTRYNGVAEGPRARWGGVMVIAVGLLFTLGLFSLTVESAMLPLIFVILLVGIGIGSRLPDSRKRKRKRDMYW